MEAKLRLRRWATTLDPVSAEESRAVVGGLAAWLRRLPPSGVVTYLSMPGEVRAEEVAEAAGSAGHRFYTTRTPTTGPLTIHPFDAPREVHPRHGYQQPRADAPGVDEAESIGIVLVPGLCFDRRGGRLGRGRGYYDRLLADIPDARRVAVTLERFLVDRVAVEPHDIAMTDIATELGVRSVP
jgi:5-formyltetrahydrofolate cyclo-ligase